MGSRFYGEKNLLQYNMATVVKGELFLAYKINDVTSAHQRGGGGAEHRGSVHTSHPALTGSILTTYYW